MRSIDDLSLDELGDRLCEGAAHISAYQYRWLRLLSAFDERRGWAAWGCRSCAHWLNWRCGLDLRSARDKVRVARALDDLPLVCEAFGHGEISYSKVRAITRVATPQTEAELLMFARHGTTQHVEKIVRGYRRCLPAADAEVRHDKRYVDWRYDEDGSIVIRARLDPEEGALVVQAIQQLREEVRKTNRLPDGPEDGSAEPPRDRADALVEMSRRSIAGEKTNGSSAERYTVMVHADASVFLGGDGVCRIHGAPVAAETLRRLTCDGSLVALLKDAEGNTLSVGRKTRTIPASIRRALMNRDEGCRFPGCTCKAFLDGHHVKHWSHGGETALSNLILLCPFHHRQMHEGAVSLRAEPDGKFTFLRPDGRLIETAALSVGPGGVEEENEVIGLKIDAATGVPRWAGDPCDYGVAVEGLLIRDGLGAWPPTKNGSAEPRQATSGAWPC